MSKINKYKNKKEEYDNIIFDSKMECDYYKYLKDIGIDFELQPRFLLQDEFKKAGKVNRKIEYVADFRVGNKVIDVKGMETQVFKLKKKMFDYKYPELELILMVECPKYLTEHSQGGLIDKKLHAKLKRKKKVKKNDKSTI